MTRSKKTDDSVKPHLFTPEGKPLRVLSTSLGIALLANALYAAGPQTAFAESATPTSSAAPNASASVGATLVEWSSDEVKKYFDPSVDWNIPLSQEESGSESGTTEEGTGTAAASGSGGSTVIHSYSGFGWDDLLLYHLIMGRGSSYSSSGYFSGRPVYDSRSGKKYAPHIYNEDAFRNKPVFGSTVRPKTSDSSGSTTRGSSSKGGIGGKSSGFSLSNSSGSSGGFGG